MRNIALAYAARGWRVLPLHAVSGAGCSCGDPACPPKNRGKHPRLWNGARGASAEAAAVRSWWGRWPDASVGIATGPAGDRHLVVLDVDGPAGEETLDALECRHGELPATREAVTGRDGGRHLYLSHGGLVHLGCRAFRGLDIKGAGGYVVAPPSVHASGRAYSWASEREPAWLPREWIDALRAPRREPVAVPTPPAPAIAGRALVVLSSYSGVKALWENRGGTQADQSRSGYDLAIAHAMLGYDVAPRDVVAAIAARPLGHAPGDLAYAQRTVEVALRSRTKGRNGRAS